MQGEIYGLLRASFYHGAKIRNSAVFAPRGKLVGECLPQTLLCSLRRLSPPRSCGKKGGHDHAKEIQHTPPQPPHTAGDPDSDTLVVYFSWSSSQNTEHMAEYIAEATGAYLVEILPEEPYEGSYNDVAYGRAHALLLPPHIRSLPSRAVETTLLLFPRICFASAREP